MGIHDFWLFLAAGLLLNVTPGPDMALVIARATTQGRRAGAAAALGIGAGTFVHIAAAAIGLSALIVASAWAFTLVKWLGALYLICLGFGMLRATLHPPATASGPLPVPPQALRHIFVQGFLTNVLNPKVAAFFLAFLPQFVDADAVSKVAAFVTLGLVFNVVGTAWNLAVAWFAGTLAASADCSRLRLWLERAIGALFMAVGVRLALAERG